LTLRLINALEPAVGFGGHFTLATIGIGNRIGAAGLNAPWRTLGYIRFPAASLCLTLRLINALEAAVGFGSDFAFAAVGVGVRTGILSTLTFVSSTLWACFATRAELWWVGEHRIAKHVAIAGRRTAWTSASLSSALWACFATRAELWWVGERRITKLFAVAGVAGRRAAWTSASVSSTLWAFFATRAELWRVVERRIAKLFAVAGRSGRRAAWTSASVSPTAWAWFATRAELWWVVERRIAKLLSSCQSGDCKEHSNSHGRKEAPGT
jgi:hypothetical protein